MNQSDPNSLLATLSNPVAPTNNTASYTPYGQTASNALNSAQSVINPQQSPTPVSQPQDKGNWFTHLLPTIGSFAGMAAPMVLGAIGAPETGGLSLLAALGLAGGGSALGKVAQNAVQGDKQNLGDIAGAAAEGAGGQLLGEGVGRVLGAGGDLIKGTLDSSVAGQAAKELKDAEAAAQVAKQASDASEVTRLGHEFHLQQNDQFLQPHIQSTVDDLKNFGFETPTAADAKSVGNIITGSNENGTGILNSVKQDLLKSAGGEVKIGNYAEPNTISGNFLKNLQDPSSMAQIGDPLNRGSIAQNILAKFDTMANGAGLTKEAGGVIQSDGAFNLLSQVNDEANNAFRAAASKNATPQDQAISNAWNSLKNDLKDAVYNRPEVNAAVANMKVTPELSNIIDSKIAAEGITDPKVAANIKQYLTDTINNSQTMPDLLSQESKAVKMSQIGESALKQQGNISAPSTQALLKNDINGQLPPSPSAIPTNNSGQLFGQVRDMASILGAGPTGGLSLLGLVPHVVNAATNPDVQKMALKLIDSGVSKKIASVLPNVLTGASQFLTHANDQTAAPVNLNLGSNNMNQQQGLDPNSLNSVLLQLALAQASNPGTASAGANLESQILPQMQNANAAQQAVSGAETAFQQAGGGQGGIMGNIQKFLGGITGNPASQYEQQRQSLVNLLQGTAQTPGLAPGMAVPDITGNNQSAANQFQTIEALLKARLQGNSVLGNLPQ